jgi:hypothetical protein
MNGLPEKLMLIYAFVTTERMLSRGFWKKRLRVIREINLDTLTLSQSKAK